MAEDLRHPLNLFLHHRRGLPSPRWLAALLMLPATVIGVLLLNEPAAAPAVVVRLPADHGAVTDAAPELLPAAANTAVATGRAMPAGVGAPVLLTSAGPVPVSAATPVTPLQLSLQRPLAARAFLDAVQLAPHPRGGFQVLAVEPGSRPARMGLRPGDRFTSFDTPLTAQLDEGSMVALMLQTTLELDIFRDGQPMRLQLALDRDDPDDEEDARHAARSDADPAPVAQR